MIDSVYKSAILILGPDVSGKEEYLPFLTNRIDYVFVVGNGQYDIMNATGHGEFMDSMVNISQLGIFTNKEDKTFIIIDAHGITSAEGNHMVLFGQNNLLYLTKHLFQSITNIFNKPVDIILTSCNGGGALKDIDVLPQDSHVVMFSANDESTFNSNLAGLFKGKFPKSAIFSIHDLYDHYLFNLCNKESPIFASVGGKVIDPSTIQLKYIGKQLNEDANKHLKEKLINVCDNNACVHYINQLIDKIEHGSTYDLFPVSNGYLSTVKELFNYEAIFFNSTFNNNIEKYWYKELQQSPAILQEFANTANGILERGKIPANIDMDKLVEKCGEEDEDEDYEDTSEFEVVLDKQANNNYAIYELLLDMSFIQANNKFLLPEKPDYGPALLAIKYLDEYCSQNNCFIPNTGEKVEIPL